MDVFSRTFLPATAEAALPIPTVSRHMPLIRRCVEPDDATMFITRCLRPDRPPGGQHLLLLLTRRRLVVTHETRMLRRTRLYLNARLGDLHNVSWRADDRQCAIELAATAGDGLRERFWITLGDRTRVSHVDALLSHVFRPRLPAARLAAQPAPVVVGPMVDLPVWGPSQAA